MKSTLGIIMVIVITSVTCLANPVSLNSDQKRKLNVFFSNFSEAYVASFSQNTLSDQQIIKFALRHNYINRFKSLMMSADGFSVLVPADQVDATAMKYLGRRVNQHQSRTYSVPLADGEAYRFSQLDSLQSIDRNLFRATGTIYSAFDAGVNPHATRAEWNRANAQVDAEEKFTAIIRREGNRYILLEYMLSGL